MYARQERAKEDSRNTSISTRASLYAKVQSALCRCSCIVLLRIKVGRAKLMAVVHVDGRMCCCLRQEELVEVASAY